MRSREAINASERAFWDAHAAGMHPSRMPPKPPDGFELSILNALGPLEGLRVLEAGCGAGDITLELLRRGAHVTALDLSPELVEITRARIERWAPEGTADVRVAPLEATGLEEGGFDRACGKWILHHTDVAATGHELARVLAPSGRAVFFENHDRNPVLRFARRHLMTLPGVDRVGTLDERPMSEEDFDALRREFAEVEFAYPSIYLFELMSRQLLRHRFVRRLAALDTWLWWRVPRLRPYGYHVLVLLTR